MERGKILLVEDERKIADTLSSGLGEMGYDVQVAYDGDYGWQLFQSTHPNLVVLDINLPGMNGYKLCDNIRRKNEKVPIIMLTALSSLNDKIEGYNLGADDYIVKPFEFKELVMKIKVLLKRTSSETTLEETILSAQDLELNLQRKEVKRGDTSISLTAKEFQLLEYLLRNKNHVLSRSEIAKNVWDIDFDTNTNVIDVYINYLRNKVDKPFINKLIQTHVGMGYVLKE